MMYGLTIRSIFFFLHHQTRAGLRLDCVPAVVRFICGVLAVFALEYDLLPHAQASTKLS